MKALINELQRYVQWSGRNDIKQQVTSQLMDGQPVLSAGANDLINQWMGGRPVDADNLSKLIKALEEFAAKASFVNITLAAPAPASLRQAIVSWFRQNVRSDLLVDFNFNATMLGGMAVRYGSHVFDWSFKRQILANRSKFPEILRNV